MVTRCTCDIGASLGRQDDRGLSTDPGHDPRVALFLPRSVMLRTAKLLCVRRNGLEASLPIRDFLTRSVRSTFSLLEIPGADDHQLLRVHVFGERLPHV